MLAFLVRAHRLIGSERVRLLHLNDSRALLGSRRESHALWGQGFLGKEGLRVLLGRPEYDRIVAIHEPPLGSPEDDARSLAFLAAG
jgi:deoxyribonuclease-4